MGRGKLCLEMIGLASATLSIAAPVRAQSEASAGETGEKRTVLEQVVVTAQRRSQSLEDVPLAVSALTADGLSNNGIAGTETLQAGVPSLHISRNGNLARPFIRGIGSNIGDANSEASVALYLDGVYMPSAFGNFFEFNNIERVEVLKGPQGTLFGRNATGGVIQVITKDPASTPEAEVSVGYANYDKLSTSGYGSIPLGEHAGINLAVIHSKQDKGYGRSLTTGAETGKSEDLGARVKLLLEPSEATSIRLAADYSRTQNSGVNGQLPPGAVNIAGQPSPGRFNVYDNFEQSSDIKSRGASLRIDHDFGPLQVASISAYRKTDGGWTLDQDESPLPLVNASIYQGPGDMISQEVHLLSPADTKLQWLIGAYYFDYEAGHTPLRLLGWALDPGFPGCLPASCNVNAGIDLDNRTATESVSVFGQGTYPILDNTNLTLGYRYSRDDIQGRFETTVAGTPIVIDSARRELSYEEPTWRISLDHRFTPDWLVYVSYNRGAKSGGIGVGGVASTNMPYQPEKLDAYEVGAKGELGARARLNAAVFYYDFQNIQFQRIERGSGVIFNGGKAEVLGAEAELEWQAADHLVLNLSVGWQDNEIGDFPGAPSTVRLANGLTAAGDPSFNAEGNHLPQAPEFTGSIGFNYDIPTALGTFSLNGNAYHNSGVFHELDNRLETDAYTLLNASLGWMHPDETFNVRVWGRNLSDEYYYVQMSGQADAADIASPAAPRTYGVTVGYNFR